MRPRTGHRRRGTRRRPLVLGRIAAAALAGTALLAPARAIGFDRFEIQVYQADLNEPGRLGLEVHTNFTVSGAREPAFRGEIPPDRTGRVTLEPALGLTRWLELGGYLQTLAAPGFGPRYGGVKLRAKAVAPALLGPRFFLGLNVEIANVPPQVEEARWSNELRPFLGYDDGLVLLDVNPILGWALSGPNALRPELEPAAKIAVNTQRWVAVGVEWYGDLGFVDDIRSVRDQAHYLFAVLDLVPPRGRARPAWEVNLAVGTGIGRAADQHAIVKSIIGRSF